MNNKTAPDPEDQCQAVAELLGLKGPDQLGGNLVGFMFTKGDRTICFGYANFTLGYSVTDEEGNNFENGDMPESGPHDAKSQAEFIKTTCSTLGYIMEGGFTEAR
jgi:hypothetical protein